MNLLDYYFIPLEFFALFFGHGVKPHEIVILFFYNRDGVKPCDDTRKT